MHGWRTVTLAGAVLVVALAFPGVAAAAPSCDPSLALGNVHIGESVHGNLTCDDPSGTGLNYFVTTDGTRGSGTVDPAGGVDYYAGTSSVGADSFTIEVDDNSGGSTTVTVNVTVTDHAPTCQAVDLGTVPRNQTAFGNVSCTDVDGDPLNYSIVAQPTHGTADSLGDLEYTPNTGYVGTDSFTYKATDGALDSSATNVTVTVQNNAPTCDNGGTTQPLRTGKPITLDLGCFDIDGDPLTISITSPPSHGTLGSVTNDGFGDYSVTYTPTGSYTGPDQFTYRASDGDKQSTPATYNLSVTPNHAPVCYSATQSFHAHVSTATPVFVDCTDDDPQDQGHLTYSVVTAPAHGTLGTFTGNQVQYTPTTGYTGVDSFTIRGSDGTLSDTTTVPMHVADGPLCSTPPAVTVRSGQSRELFVDCTQPDDVLTTLLYEITVPPGKGTLNPAGEAFDGTRTYTANTNATGTDTYSIAAKSGSSTSPSVVQSITTGPNVNNAPVCTNDFGTETAFAGRVTRLFPDCSDLDGDPLTFAVPTQPAHGTSSVPNDRLTYVATAGYTGSDSVPFTVSDGHGGSTSFSEPVDVRAPEAPTCTQGPITATVRPGGHTTLQLECDNPQFDPQSFAAASAPSKGSLGAFGPGGSVVYTANSGASGTDTFTLKAIDAVGDSAPQQVTITFDPNFNQAPECDSNASRPQHVVKSIVTPLKLSDVCSDPDGDPLVFVRKSQASLGTVDAGPAASLSYTAGSTTGPDSFTYVARDDRGLESAVTTYSLQVDTSIAPTCTAQPAVSLRPNQVRHIGLDCNDPNGNQITYKIVSGPASGSLSPAGDSTGFMRTYTAPATEGDGSFTYRASSAGGDSPVYTQTVTVANSANQAPVCVPNSGFPQKVPQGRTTALQIDQACDDGDNDPLTFTRVAPNPQHGTATATNGVISYTPTNGYTGADTIGYQADDGHGGTRTGTFTVDVEPVTPPTCATPDALSVRPGRQVEVDFICTDPFDGALSYTIITAPSHGTLDPAGDGPSDARNYTAGSTAADDTIAYQAVSPTGTSTTYTQTIHITPSANFAPDCAGNSANPAKVAAGHARTLTPDCFDEDGDSLTFSKLSNPAHGTLSDTGGQLVYTPNNGFTGQDTFNYTASDGHGGTSGPEEFFVEVIQPSAPTCDTPAAITVRPNGARTVQFSCTNVLDEPLTYSIVSAPSKGTLSGSGDSRTYTAGASAGTDSFTWRAHGDGTGDSATMTQPVTIDSSANVAPVCPSTFSAQGKANVARTITPACTDGDGDALSFSKVTSPAHGTLTDTGGVLRYTAASGYSGSDAFTYRAGDGHGGQSAVSTVSLTDSAANVAPTCAPVSKTTAQETAVSIALSCSDADGDPLTLAQASGPSHGSLGAISNGSVTYTPAAGYSGADSFTYRANDGTANSAPATVSLTVTPKAQPTPTPTPTTTPTPTPTTTPTPGPTPAPKATVSAAKQKLATVIAKGVVVKASCDRACTLSLQLVLDKATAKKLKLGTKAVVVGKLTAQPGTLKIKLTSKAKKAFKKAKAVKLKLIATPSGTGGKGSPATITVTLKK